MKLAIAMCIGVMGCGSDTTKVVTEPAPDTTPPVVLFTTTTPQISAVFSEAMDPSTLTPSTFTVLGVTGTVSIADGRTAVFTPTALAAATTYTATVTTGAQDLAGNYLAAEVSWTFTTDAAPDTTPPSIMALSPAPATTGRVRPNAVSVTYDEPIDCARATDSTIRVFDAGSEVPGYVTCAAATVAFHATRELPSETILDAYAEPMPDLAGNQTTAQTVWSFATGPWTIEDGTTANDDIEGMTVDSLGFLYVVGSTAGGLAGNTNAGGGDLYVTKYDPSGTPVWTRQMGTAGLDFATGVAVDPLGNVIVGGASRGDFDGNTNASAAGTNDIIVVKLDQTGTKLWSHEFGSPANDTPVGLAIDASGNIYLAGITTGGLNGNTSAGSYDLFAMKLDSTGTPLWTHQLGTTGTDFTNGMALDASGNVYVCGYTAGGLDGNTSSGGTDAFVVRYTSAGIKQWTLQIGTAGDDQANGCTVGPNGHVYVAGTTTGSLFAPNAGQGDAFVGEYTALAAEVHTVQFGGTGDESATTIVHDPSGNVYFIGVSNGALDATTTNAGGYDTIFAAFDGLLNPLWTSERGGAGDDFALAGAIDAFGTTYAAGYTTGTIDGNTNQGGQDLFVVKTAVDGKAR